MSSRYVDENWVDNLKSLSRKPKNVVNKIKQVVIDASHNRLNPFRKKTFMDKVKSTEAYGTTTKTIRNLNKSAQNLHNTTPTAVKAAVPIIAAGVAAAIIKSLHDKKKKEKKNR